MTYDDWFLVNKPDLNGLPIEYYKLVKEFGRQVWKESRDEERIRCGLVAETFPFSHHIGKNIAAKIYKDTISD